ncbi:hypothetical protein NQZ79_g5691 [Umbelopsis isabellina]|nr:hypothetical protein NQZ79_g5691 [Umbelopsis isabellina]
MTSTKLTVPHERNGKSSPVPILVDYPDSQEKVTTAIVLTHGASGDYSSGNLPLLAESLAGHGYAIIRCSLTTVNLAIRVDAMTSVLSYLFEDDSKNAKEDPVVSKLRASITKIFIGGHSMGARVVVSIAGEQNKEETTSSKKAKSVKNESKTDTNDGFAHKLHGVITFSYPLHPPGKQSQLRDQILFDLPETSNILMLSGTKDPFGEMPLMNKVQDKMTCSLMAVRIEKAGHSLLPGKSKKTDKNTKKTQEETLLYSIADRIDKWIKNMDNDKESAAGNKRKRENKKAYETMEISFANDVWKVSYLKAIK